MGARHGEAATRAPFRNSAFAARMLRHMCRCGRTMPCGDCCDVRCAEDAGRRFASAGSGRQHRVLLWLRNLAYLPLRDLRRGVRHSDRDGYWRGCLLRSDMGDKARKELVRPADAGGNLRMQLDVRQQLLPGDGLVPGVCARSRACAQSAVEVPVVDAVALGVCPLAVVACVARTLQFCRMEFPDV